MAVVAKVDKSQKYVLKVGRGGKDREVVSGPSQIINPTWETSNSPFSPFFSPKSEKRLERQHLKTYWYNVDMLYHDVRI